MTAHLTWVRLFVAIGCASVIALLVTTLGTLIGSNLTAGEAVALLDIKQVFWGDRPDNTEAMIFFHSRLPRMLTAIVVGAGLAGAGCTYQAVLRNPLADPFTLGIASGASLAAVVAIRLGFSHSFLGAWAIGIAALSGAVATAYIVWRLGRVGRALPPATLLLGGIIIAAFCSAATMLVQYTADLVEINMIVRWMMGGLVGASYQEIAVYAGIIGASLLVLLFFSRDLNALSAGSDAAASVGVNVTRVVSCSFVTASLIVGATISVAGPIGFIGLMVPHAMRALVGADHRILLPISMIAGATMLVACDTIARLAAFPVGIITALMGGPFFLYLLVRQKGSGLLWGGDQIA